MGIQKDFTPKVFDDLKNGFGKQGTHAERIVVEFGSIACF